MTLSFVLIEVIFYFDLRLSQVNSLLLIFYSLYLYIIILLEPRECLKINNILDICKLRNISRRKGKR